MKQICNLLAIILTLVVAAPCRSQERPPAKTSHHDVLLQDVGTWDAVMKVWAGGPNTQPMVMNAVETNTSMGAGVWILSDFRCEGQGFQFVGHGQIGYDASKQKYVGTWIDSMSNHLNVMEGDYDATKKTMTMISHGVNPQTGQPSESKNIGRYLDADHRVFEMHDKTSDGSFVKTMEISYTRQEDSSK